MLKAPTRPPYTTGAALVARSPFAFDGRRFYPGDPFDLGDDRRRRQLWEARKVEVSDTSAGEKHRAPGVNDLTSSGDPSQRQPPKSDNVATAATPHPNENQATTYAAISKGFGRFDVVDQTTGEVIESGLSKAAAKSKAEALNKTRRGAGEPGAAEGVVCPPAAPPGSIPSSTEE